MIRKICPGSIWDIKSMKDGVNKYLVFINKEMNSLLHFKIEKYCTMLEWSIPIFLKFKIY